MTLDQKIEYAKERLLMAKSVGCRDDVDKWSTHVQELMDEERSDHD